jgi:transposase
LDLGDKYSHIFALGEGGEILEEGRVSTSPSVFRGKFSAYRGAHAIIEVGSHSPWAYRILTDCGLKVLVANPRRVALIAQGTRKSDRCDAETLARLGRADPQLLSPIRHRGLPAQRDLALVRARDSLVRARTRLINCIKGLAKAFGGRVVCGADAFHKKAQAQLPPELADSVQEILEAIGTLTAKIKSLDEKIEKLSRDRYPETARLQRVPGVGPITALAFVLVLEDPKRFARSRTVGAYLGLTPKQHDSGERQPQLRITKAGDAHLRWLLIQCAQYIFHRASDSDLKRYGRAIALRGGKNAKKRAIVAIARKLAVLLHRLWVTGEDYKALRNPTPEKVPAE